MDGFQADELAVTTGTGTFNWPRALNGEYTVSFHGTFTSGTITLKFAQANEGETPGFEDDYDGAIEFTSKKVTNIKVAGLMQVVTTSFVGTDFSIRLKQIA